jgi:hypothetical protein
MKIFRRRGGRRVFAAAMVGLTVVAVGTGVATAEASTSAREAIAANAVVSKPPMGWASWNSVAAQINIDEGWWQGTRDAAGNITVNTAEWPGGMKAIADHIHSKGHYDQDFCSSPPGVILRSCSGGNSKKWTLR